MQEPLTRRQLLALAGAGALALGTDGVLGSAASAGSAANWRSVLWSQRRKLSSLYLRVERTTEQIGRSPANEDWVGNGSSEIFLEPHAAKSVHVRAHGTYLEIYEQGRFQQVFHDAAGGAEVVLDDGPLGRRLSPDRFSISSCQCSVARSSSSRPKSRSMVVSPCALRKSG